MITIKFTHKGRLIGLNEYTSSNRANLYGANAKKKAIEEDIIWSIREAKLTKVSNYPIKLKITWYEPTKRRDIDNITFAVKFILDALVKARILENDNQKHVHEIEHKVLVDRDYPRIEIELKEKQND